MNPEFPILTKIQSPADLKQLSLDELSQLCQELRSYIIQVVSQTGGHLAPTLGVVELTVALHRVFDSPKDKIVWDVGHQAYAHKVLTGRREALKTIRQYGGISGFLKREESEHDIFGAGHASTSISAALGVAKARDIKGEDYQVVAVIGDGAMTGGLAFEGLNNVGQLRTRMLVILNDNEMSISPNVGAISHYLHKLVTNPIYNRVRDEIWRVSGTLPLGEKVLRPGLKKIEESLKNLLVPGIIFDEMGLRYFGPIQGHNLPLLIETLNKIKDIQTPVLLHVLTKKGKGLEAAEADPVRFHGVGPNGHKEAKKPQAPAYLEIFGRTVVELADKDARVVTITAAMREGTGLTEFSEKYPSRYFDVGIAEGHAVTFAGGLASQGLRPVVAIYSTFLQRAYDHIIHDVALQKLPVIFALDRAGLVGPDGPTHHGAFDLSYLQTVPGVVIAAPRDGNELRNLLHTALDYEGGPFFVRYPKDNCVRYDPQAQPEILPIGSWEVINDGREGAIVAVGAMVEIARQTLARLPSEMPQPMLVNARFIKPWDEELLRRLLTELGWILVLEENTVMGSLGNRIQALAQELGVSCQVRSHALPDRFITHGSRPELLREVGLDEDGILADLRALQKEVLHVH